MVTSAALVVAKALVIIMGCKVQRYVSVTLAFQRPEGWELKASVGCIV